MASLEDSLLEGSPLECTICLERMKNISFLSTQPDEDGNFCVHWFCTECIEPYIAKAVERNQDPKCPSCRRVILGVNRCKAANELLREINRERELRKQIAMKQEQTANELKDLNQLREQDQQQHIKEMRLVVDQIRKVQGMLEEEKRNKEIAVKSLNDKLEEHTQLSEMLQNQLKTEKVRVEESKLQLQLLQKELEETQNLVREKAAEAEKWNKMYLRTFDELNTKTKQLMMAERKINTNNSSTSSPPHSSKNLSLVSTATSPINYNSLSGLASWISPTFDKITELSNPLTTYLWGGRSGILLRNPEEFKFIERRGSGRYCSVWKASCKLTGDGIRISPTKASTRIVALKKLNDQHLQCKNFVDGYREAMFLYKLDHRNIVKLEGLIRDQTVPNTHTTSDFMVITFVELDLEYLLSDQMTIKLRSPQIRLIMHQILSALYYLHSGEIVHRNIQPTSILMDESINVKLGGFGSARSLHSQPFNSSPQQSFRYSPPENAYLSETTKLVDHWKAGDIWAAGCVFAEMLSNGIPLFDAKDKMTLLSKIAAITETKPQQSDKSRFPLLNSIPSMIDKPLEEFFSNSPIEISPDAFDLLKSMLAFDPARRISAMETLQHKYFTSANLVDVPRTCPLASELGDDEVANFVVQYCGGV